MSWLVALTLLVQPIAGYTLPDRLYYRLGNREHRRQSVPPIFYWGRW